MAEVHTPPATDAVSHNGAATDTEEGHAAPGQAELTGATEDHGGGHAEPTAFGFDASGWVAWSMIAVLLLMIWKRVPSAIGKALDRKIAGIRHQLDEAAQLRAEAILRQAETDAAALVERRTRIAEDKIAAAERAAVDEVRARAASAAATAAERLIRDRL